MRILVSVIIALFAALPAGAGTLIEFGIKAGANASYPRGLQAGITSVSDVTFVGGAFFQVGLGDLLAIGVELTYEGREFTLTNQEPGADWEFVDLHSSTVNIPLFLRIGLPLRLSIELGVEYAHFLSDPPAVYSDGQGLALIGLAWHPVDPIRIGARFKPSISSLSVSTINDLNINVANVYVAWIIL